MGLIYGIHAVEEALKADRGKIEKVCIQRGQKNPRLQEIIDRCRESHIPISFEARDWLDRRTDRQRHQGVLCYVAEMPTYTVDDILEKASAPGLLLILDGIEDPHNVGAILRSAEVAAADGVFLPQHRSAGLGTTAVKTSAGAASHVKVARAANTAQLIDLLKKNGYWVAGLDAGTGRPIWEADFTIPTVLVLGSEGGGLHRLVREKCDFLVAIPVRGKISSHNVSVAAGIALYEVIRQRRTIDD
ncbi:MAG TPA: 23S rRNA (guanosine(2251)-2'-O)-methyltransferase RlmB [Acidobacteriota bacterium]|nr:23S rRNA (guanosine(2251)-2'-O)-methyltransferase RlmB [Acidobacteriota bacterium]